MAARHGPAPSAARAVAGRLSLPPPRYRPYALPGAAPIIRARWAGMVRRAPVMTVEEHAAAVGVGELEEVIGCSLCGERRVRALFYVRPGRAARRRYHVVLCARCGFLYRHPGIRPERLGDLYGSGQYGTFLTGHYSARRRRRYRLVMNAFWPLFERGDGRRLLDFGSGAGLFLELAHRRGFDCYGVDLAPDAVEYARTRPGGANSFYGSPRDVPEIAAGGFHVITLWSVLAHLATPVEDLSMLRGLLTDDGVLLVLTVNANSLELKAQRARWGGFTPNHLKIFAPSTLSRLLQLAGFAAVAFRPMLPDHVVAGKAQLTPRQLLRMRRNIERHNEGNMLRAVAFADPDGPTRWGMRDSAVTLARPEPTTGAHTSST
jgi:2-polyprenyl-3-methyl-5-hydroxy-6-metoxy-1,4-benzoquinol methylase